MPRVSPQLRDPGTPVPSKLRTYPSLSACIAVEIVDPLRFRDQQMYVLRHNDISQNYQSISATYTFQNLQKQVAAQCIAQQRLAVIAAEREKVKIPRAVSTVKIFGHRWRVEQLGLCLSVTNEHFFTGLTELSEYGCPRSRRSCETWESRLPAESVVPMSRKIGETWAPHFHFFHEP